MTAGTSWSGMVRPEEAPSIRLLSVRIPPGTRQVTVDLTYDPRTLDDRDHALRLVAALAEREGWPDPPQRILDRFWPLRNLLNVVLYDPRGRFRGRWDRNRPGQPSTALLAERGSSPGMVDGAIPPGEWQLALEVYQVLVPVEYRLRVEWSEGEETGVGVRGPGSAAADLRASVPTVHPAKASGPRWLRGELHVHTEHSDGLQPVAEVAAAMAQEVDFFALTDHNTTTGLRDLPAPGLLVVPGVEVTTFYGHAICLGVDEVIPWYVGTALRPMSRIAAEARAAGGVVCVAHPLSPPSPLCGGCRWTHPEFSWHDADLLEIWNGDRDEHAPINRAALALWDALLCQGLRLVGVAGSDLHDVARLRTHCFGRTLVYARPEISSILDALRAGRVVVTAGPHLRITARAGDKLAEVGDTLVVRPGEEVVVSGSAEDVAASHAVRLVVAGTRVPVPARWEHALRPTQPTWVRVEVVSDGILMAATNPVFIDVSPR